MIQDDVNLDSEDELEEKETISKQKFIPKDTQEEEKNKERHCSMINEMLDDFTKEETLKLKKTESLFFYYLNFHFFQH